MENPKCIKPSYLFLFSIICVSSFVMLEANIAEMDDYWKSKAEQSQVLAKTAYKENSTATINSLNKAVSTLLSDKSEGRHLQQVMSDGKCHATNPIDKCWRCRKNWADERKRLAKCVQGFASGTTGGAAGEIYVVTDSSDNDVKEPKKGTLRWGAIQKQPLWIIFAHSMTIHLKQELMIASHKTIDGRGANVEIANGCQLTIQFEHNVIIHNLRIRNIIPCSGGLVRDHQDHCGFRTRSDGDGVSLFGATNVWIDHVTMSNCADGLIDVIDCSTAVTISNGLFTDHDHVMLFGANDTKKEDKMMQVTIAFNHFGEKLVQRMPRIRWGFAHVLNNDYTHWLNYAIGGSHGATIISQGNRFNAPNDRNAKEVTRRAQDALKENWKSWIWRSQGDLFENGAFFTESGQKSTPHFEQSHMIQAQPGTAVSEITRYAGVLQCQVGKEC